MKHTPSLSLVMALIMTSCGVSKEEPDTPCSLNLICSPKIESEKYPPQPQVSTANFESKDASNEEILADSELLGQEVSLQIDIATAAIADIESSDSGFQLYERSVARSGEVSRECQEVEDAAEVSVNFDLERSWSASRRGRRASHAVIAKGEYQRVWSSESESLTCNANGKRPELKLLDLPGVSMSAEFSTGKSVSTALFNFTREKSHNSEGSRTTTWNSAELVDTEVHLNKSITGNADRTLFTKTAKGEERTIRTSSTISDDSPLEVAVVRNASTGLALEQTIISGKVTAERGAKGILVTEFDNVRYLKEDGCFPRSGKISGSYFKDEAAEPVLTFAIVFEEGSKHITFSDGKEYEYTPEGCDLEITED